MRPAADLRAHDVARFRAEDRRVGMRALPEHRAPVFHPDEALRRNAVPFELELTRTRTADRLHHSRQRGLQLPACRVKTLCLCPGSNPQSAGAFFFCSGSNFPAPLGMILRWQKADVPAWMRDKQPMATEFRRYAAMCVGMAERMSVVENRNRMMEMAERFLQRAQKEDVKAE
jgi:hypothetical protein